MADGDEASNTPSPPPYEIHMGGPSTDVSQLGHQNLLMLQHITGMFKDAVTQARHDMRQEVDERLASKMAENPTPPAGTNGGGGRERTDEQVPPTKSDKVSFKTFKTSGATEFDGVIDPIQAFQWIKHTEKIFRISHCAEGDKVNYATAMLTGTAMEWWEGIFDTMTPEQQKNISWESFKEKLLKQYCPVDLQIKYERQFLELKQGPMTVSSYLTEFIRKSKFAADYVSTEAKKVERFIYGLRMEIREILDGRRDITTLEEAAEQARRREDILATKRAEEMPPPKKARTDFYSGPTSFRPANSHRPFSQGQNHSRSYPNNQVQPIIYICTSMNYITKQVLM